MLVQECTNSYTYKFQLSSTVLKRYNFPLVQLHLKPSEYTCGQTRTNRHEEVLKKHFFVGVLMFYLQNAVLYKTLSCAESLSGCTYILTFIHNSSSTARKKDWDTVETSMMTICWNDDMQPAKHKCHACCQQQAKGGWIKSVVDYTHDTRVERFVSTFQKIPQMFVTCSEHYWIILLFRILRFLLRSSAADRLLFRTDARLSVLYFGSSTTIKALLW